MFDTERVKGDFSAAADSYDKYAALQARVLARLVEKTLPLLAENAALLDAGCGTGRLKPMLPKHTLTQLDYAFAMCAKAAVAEPRTVNGTVAALPFADKSFGGVICSLVLQWVPEQSKALEEMKRVLTSGGVRAVSSFGPDTLKELRESFAAVDRYAHVSSFASGAAFPERETITEYYPDVLSLMRHLKAIGARNKLLGRRRSLMTRGAFARLEKRYGERFGGPQGLPVTWDVRYEVVRV